MRIVINSLVVVACIVLLNIDPSFAEVTDLEAVDELTVQQCNLAEGTPLQLVHGRHPYHYHPPHPSHHYVPPHYHPSVYPPPYPYYAPYPASNVCRNQLFFCHMNAVLPVGSPCVCYAPFGVVWFSGRVTVY